MNESVVLDLLPVTGFS